MRRIVSSTTLVMEAFVLGFAILIARENDAPGWQLAALAVFALVLLLFPRVLSRRGAYTVGSALQVALVLTGLIVSVMWFLGTLFAVLWFGFLALSIGVENDQRARAAAAEPEAPADPG